MVQYGYKVKERECKTWAKTRLDKMESGFTKMGRKINIFFTRNKLIRVLRQPIKKGD